MEAANIGHHQIKVITMWFQVMTYQDIYLQAG